MEVMLMDQVEPKNIGRLESLILQEL